MEDLKDLYFADKLNDLNPRNTFISSIAENIKTKSALLQDLYIKLRFPDYFGFNWDALNDCLCDLSWTEQKEIIIWHQDIPDIEEKDLEIYLDILIKATKFLREKDLDNELVNLKVFFPASAKKKIIGLIK